MELNQIFNIYKYDEAYKYATTNGYVIEEISQNNKNQRQFKIVEKPLLTSDEIAEIEINTLKAELQKYDYIGVKIAMGVATKEEYADKIAYTETLRKRIRELEEQI